MPHIFNAGSPTLVSNFQWGVSLSSLEGAYSHNTIRSYRADFRHFGVWCARVGQSALPASPETVAAYIEALVVSHAPASIGRRMAAIGRIHRLFDLNSPTTSQNVPLALRRMYRSLSRRQRQPTGLCADLRDKLIAACGTDLRGLRNRALITVGYETLCRRSELVSLRVEDISELADGAGSVLIRRSKADQFGDGRLAYLSSQTLATVDNWLSASGISAGPMFRAVRKGRYSDDGLHFNAVSRIIKSLAKRAELPPDVIRNLSGHSLRIGPAIDMVEHGIDLVPIMHAGGWKSASMVLRYTQQIELSRSGMARLNAMAKQRM